MISAANIADLFEHHDDIHSRIARVLSSKSSNFVELVNLSGLDPSKHFRYANLSDIDFSCCNLSGFDFTGADLRGCKFDGAITDRALFGDNFPGSVVPQRSALNTKEKVESESGFRNYKALGSGRAVEESVSPQWLIDLKATADEMRQGRERLPGKPFGRWLGDFLDQDTTSGLLPAEEKLLFAAMNGEACVLESRAVLLWAAFASWRETMPQQPAEDLGFVESIAKFTEAAPEPVQDVIIDATRHAIEELRLPAYWEPKSVADVEKFALSQRAFLARLEAEAQPAQTIEHARRDEGFYQLAVETVIESLTPRPYEPLKLNHEWLNPMLRRDPLNLSAGMRSKIDAQPRVLRGFFEDLAHDVKRASGAEQNLADKLKADPDVLREHFDTAFARYEREQWRWVDPEDPEVQVRASFLRVLSLGGDDFAPVHESRLELHGAYVREDLDLSGCIIPQPIVFRRSHFAGRISFRGSVTKSLAFSGSHVQSITAESAQIAGGVILGNGFRSGRLIGGFRSEGLVSFSGAQIGGNFDCSGGTFLNRTPDGEGEALSLAFARIAESVRMRDGFRAEGVVRFEGAHIKGNLHCSNGRFENSSLETSQPPTRRVATAIDLRSARIDRILWLGVPINRGHGSGAIVGSVNLQGCYAREIADHPGTWPTKEVRVDGATPLPAFIYLDGFVYDRLVGKGYDPTARRRWLDRQPPNHLGVNFRSQPFEQLIKVYREVGHNSEARAIAKFKENRRYRSLFIKLWHGWRDRPEVLNRINNRARDVSAIDWLLWPITLSLRASSRAAASILLALAWAFVGCGTAYMYGWGRVLLFLITLWIVGGAFYGEVASQGGFAPSNPVIYLNESLEAKCGKHWTVCNGAPPEVRNFNPYIYSLDVMLPMLELGQKRDWQPIDRTDRLVEILQPHVTWLPIKGFKYNIIPAIELKSQPVSEGWVDAIVTAQTLLGCGALGLLFVTLSGFSKKD
jgi:hypothetical protein